ncbi:hypothetical protein EI983_03170 [Roseovarius faecimaris]|uniref:Lipoprotein n=1 Tax=Roseovarius faecimaris TaxID=2494550 RepID=A0A6I6IM09_9RHOB|nr:hypothetical protein [Roseovarius faecimaris]QGX97332.1 hypothetical protein EI983_03170 [Roseovarius faecimaris]
MTKIRPAKQTVLTACGLSLVLTLGACDILMKPKPADIVAQCKAEVAPPGTYEYEEGPGLPVIRAVEDGTEAGAESFNACIRQKAVAAGLISSPNSRAGNVICPDGAATIYGGATYCIGTN